LFILYQQQTRPYLKARAKREAEEKALQAERNRWQHEGRKEINLKKSESFKEAEAMELESNRIMSENARVVILFST
jgi:hypothetical protein